MMEVLQNVHWREPLWFGLAAVPLFFAGWRRQRRTRLLRYADVALLPWAASRPGGGQTSDLRAGRLQTLAHALAWLLLALAAAGPRVPLELPDGQRAPRHLLTVMVILDVSSSMRATDIAPDRLTRAQLELLDWLPRLQGERVGLILYAGEAGMLLPPTDDPALLRRAIDQVNSGLIEAPGLAEAPGLIEAQGTHLAAALDLARMQLAAAPGKAKAVLLLTDAEAGSADAAAQVAMDALDKTGWPLFVLGLGSEAGAPVPLPGGGYAEQAGGPVQSRLLAAPYRQWAQTTGGGFAEVSDGPADWAALHDRGLAVVPGDPIPPGVSAAWRELYAWCLLPALALFMVVSLPRRVVVGVALAILGGGLTPPAAWADEAAAWQAWQQKHYGNAQTLYAQASGYTGQMGAGAAAWRLADYGVAARHFGSALLLAAHDRQRADALYNLGNAQYARGQYSIAVEAYESVLRLRPADVNAHTNLAWATQRLRRQRAGKPMASDLRGRRGMLAEGQIPLDGEHGWQREDAESDPIGVQIERHRTTDAKTRPLNAAQPRPQLTVDAGLAVSGLKKLDRLEDRPATLLKNLLKQDARPDITERPPW